MCHDPQVVRLQRHGDLRLKLGLCPRWFSNSEVPRVRRAVDGDSSRDGFVEPEVKYGRAWNATRRLASLTWYACYRVEQGHLVAGLICGTLAMPNRTTSAVMPHISPCVAWLHLDWLDWEVGREVGDLP
jgi:hypothetical protein